MPAQRRGSAGASAAGDSGDEGRPYGGVSLADRREDQRRRLVRAAIDVFAAQGFRASSVEDIVRQARTSRAVFYRFFANRDDCLLHVYRVVSEELRAKVATATSGAPPRRLLEAAVAGYVDALLDDPAAAKVLLVEAVGVSPELERERAEQRLRFAAGLRTIWRGIDPAGAASPDADTTCVALVGALGESLAHLMWTDHLEAAHAHVPALTHLAEKVLAPPAGERGRTRRARPAG